MGGFWWQQSLWKLPPLYTNHPEAPLHAQISARAGAGRDLVGDFGGSRPRRDRGEAPYPDYGLFRSEKRS